MRSMTLMVRLALGCVGLAACSPLANGPVPELASRAKAAYQLAREEHLAQQMETARSHYLAVLAIDPDHIGARNGLAALLAENGDVAQALDIWRAPTAPLAVEGGPQSAYLFSNLGRAYLLSGAFGEAVAALEKACLLDPVNSQAWQLLGKALAGLGQDARARQMFEQAASLRAHDLRTDLHKSGRRSTVAAIEQAVQVPSDADPGALGWAKLSLHVGADGLMELRRTPAEAALAVDAPVPASVVSLQIYNGNGVTGMARAMSRSLDDGHWQVTRLRNVPRFDVKVTRIEYQPAQLALAHDLAQRLGNEQISLVSGDKSTGLKLVLGRDWRAALPGFAPDFSQRLACREPDPLKRRSFACADWRTSGRSTG